jgi:hypothetical protein
VSRSAREHFIGIHGGSHAAAEAEIRALLEDALHHGKARQLPNGRWQVMTAGYQATLSADGAAVIKYATVHRERSYAQIRAGVRSRISTTTKLPTGYQRDEQQPRPSTPGTPLSIESVRLIDPSKLALTGRAIRELARQGLAGHDDTSTRALIASDLTTDLSAAEITTAEHGHIVEGSAIRWKPSLDGNVLFSAAQRKPTLASRHRRAEPCRPHLEGSGRKSEVSKMIDYVASPKFD